MRTKDIEVGRLYVQASRAHGLPDVWEVLEVLTRAERAERVREQYQTSWARSRSATEATRTVRVRVRGYKSTRSLATIIQSPPDEKWVTPQTIGDPLAADSIEDYNAKVTKARGELVETQRRQAEAAVWRAAEKRAAEHEQRERLDHLERLAAAIGVELRLEATGDGGSVEVSEAELAALLDAVRIA